MKEIYYCEDGSVDVFTTWINNSKWSWLIPVGCIIALGFIGG